MCQPEFDLTIIKRKYSYQKFQVLFDIGIGIDLVLVLVLLLLFLFTLFELRYEDQQGSNYKIKGYTSFIRYVTDWKRIPPSQDISRTTFLPVKFLEYYKLQSPSFLHSHANLHALYQSMFLSNNQKNCSIIFPSLLLISWLQRLKRLNN